MATCSEHHKTLTDGVGKCSKPMWDGMGMPAGFCDSPAYGEQLEKKWRFYVPYLACPAHGGPSAPKVKVKEG